MKSRFFTDTQDLDTTPRSADRVCLCVLIDRRTCEAILKEARGQGLTTGEYIDQLVLDTLAPARKMESAPPLPQGKRCHVSHGGALHQHHLPVEGQNAAQKGPMHRPG